jgi:hypothetical protein
VENRAYVSAQSAQFSADPKADKPVLAQINFVNRGSTPAKNLMVQAEAAFREQPLPDEAPITASQRPGARGSAPKDELYVVAAAIPPLSEEKVKLLNKDMLRLYVWGTITYEDVFNKKHTTRFCFVSRAAVTTFQVCHNNNYID